jgi:cytochrome c553
VRIPTQIAWTSATLAQVASGSEQRGAFVALNCGAGHGEKGVSRSILIPILAGMDAVVIYKQLADYRDGKRLWGVGRKPRVGVRRKRRAGLAAERHPEQGAQSAPDD